PEEISKTRVENILRRSRSTLGTVLTSFREFSVIIIPFHRKSLLERIIMSDEINAIIANRFQTAKAKRDMA
ncbi:MAG: hypothetical protein IPP69_18255, partial [Flavobacteriales bacterium]|nr:hypothetical protein [Flavobacteriales bacterium]